MLGLPASVPRRGVEIAHAAVPGRADERRRLVVLDLVEEFAERRGAEAEFGHADVRAPELARFQGRRFAPLMSGALRLERRGSFLGLGAEAQRIALGRAGLSAARRLGLGDVLGEHGHDADALRVRGHHHVERLRFVQAKHRLQDLDHEVARRIVVVEQHDLVQARTVDFGFGLGPAVW